MAGLSPGSSWLLPLARRIVDAVLPPRCLACGAVVGEGAVCGSCWSALRFLGPPQCVRCGLPFPFPVPEATACPECIAAPPPWERARAALRYDAGSRPLLLGYKHGDRLDATMAFARWLSGAGQELVAEAEVVIPVPLHRWRLLARRYNQSAELARALGRIASRPVAPLALVRRRGTPSQSGLGRKARQRNVQGAFAVPPGRGADVAGRRVLLIDDVMTTGATAAACARALRAARASAVDVLTLARVVRDEA